MRSSSINILMIGIAACDVSVMHDIIWIKVTTWIPEADNPKCRIPDSYLFQLCSILFNCTRNFVRPSSVWIASAMALFRFLIVKNAMNSKFDFLSAPHGALVTLAILFIPNFLIEFIYWIRFSLEVTEIIVFPKNAKSDNTTTVIMLMTVSSMLSEGSYGILNFVSFCFMQNYDEYAEILSFFYFLQGLLDIFVTLNTVSHCFISLAVSTQYQNAVTSTFPFLSNSKKHTNTIRVTASGSTQPSNSRVTQRTQVSVAPA
ncbi:hypothetical protein GCK72_020630 [Caenorhabditis remanei]|uniref:G-protein coupled receptors family 1 profile domain-containing protein n=1 Tax=Caenorhabditis remanei TaxID=31234 RepID=A0A6A5GHR7_CAERE|nr:hypothetical protein GCK72_020630 [Caenorhabditis remanei]KAF1754072.1 hypothetical protein GCK72_020630 [Caenorhabditis remanei]